MQEIRNINEDERKEFIHKAFLETKDFKFAYNSMPKVLRFLALQGLFTNSFLSIIGLTNQNNLFLKGVNGINGASGFFVDVLNFSFGLEKRKKKLINENSSISRILITMLFILFLLRPLMILLFDLIIKKINKSEKYSYLLSSSVSIIQSISSILMVSFFTMSLGILIQKIIQKNFYKNRIAIINPLSESDLRRREKKIYVLMLILSIFIVLTFSFIQLLILRELSNLEEIINKTVSQKLLFSSLTYLNYLISSIITLLGIYLIVRSIFPMMKKMLEKTSEDEEKKIKKKNVFPLSIIFYISTIGLFALSAHIANLSGSLNPDNIGTIFGYDILRKVVLISGILANGLACYFIFKGITSLDNSEKLLEEFFDKENKQSIKKLEKIALRNKVIGASLIVVSALGTTGLLSTLIYAEVNNIDKISNFIKKPEFLAAISIVVITFVLLGISFYGKMNVIENIVEEYKSRNLEVSSEISKKQKQDKSLDPIKIDFTEQIDDINPDVSIP